MKIGQLVSNLHTINPSSTKAIYSHTAALSNGLKNRGHDVYVFGAEGSDVEGTLVATSPALSTIDIDESTLKYYMFHHVSRSYEYARANKLDIIHSHYNLLPLFFSGLLDIPTITSVHSPITERVRPFLQSFRNNHFVSFSLAQRRQMPEINWYANIYHGVDMNVFTYNEVPEDYVLFLGRITSDKGTHLAIEAAKSATVPIQVVGSSYPTEGYWQKEIEPHINSTTVRYLGEASLPEKITLLQNARALLFPIQWEEPFGYVMIEAMACGTPVIGYNRGSVAEIVKHGETGYVVETLDEMIEAIRHVDDIDRAKVRKRAELYFSTEKMIHGYENIYRRLLDDKAFIEKKNHIRKKKNGDSSQAQEVDPKSVII